MAACDENGCTLAGWYTARIPQKSLSRNILLAEFHFLFHQKLLFLPLQLWLALADRYLHTSGIDWNKEQAKCLSDAWLDDDEELGIQIVKDLHRTGSSLFSGPNGNLHQAKLKRILLGFSRYNKTGAFLSIYNEHRG